MAPFGAPQTHIIIGSPSLQIYYDWQIRGQTYICANKCPTEIGHITNKQKIPIKATQQIVPNAHTFQATGRILFFNWPQILIDFLFIVFNRKFVNAIERSLYKNSPSRISRAQLQCELLAIFAIADQLKMISGASVCGSDIPHISHVCIVCYYERSSVFFTYASLYIANN